MKHILLITTGGTIASSQSENGLSPAMASEELLPYLPDGFAQKAPQELLASGIGILWEEFGEILSAALLPGLRSAVLLVLTALLCALARGFDKGDAQYAELVGVLAVSSIAAGDLTTLIGAGSRTVDELHTLSQVQTCSHVQMTCSVSTVSQLQ